MIYSRAPRADSVVHIAGSIKCALQGNKTVVWLVSGGSAIELQTEIMEQLTQKVPGRLDKLTVFPIDERYGPAGHVSSNSEQMRHAGFNPETATWIDVLKHGNTRDEVLGNYKAAAEKLFSQAQVIIATLGLGTDGHTAGILPDSPAVYDTTATVVGYEWADYTRMTLGLSQLRQIEIAFVLAYGDSKEETLVRLRANQEPLSALPAKVLYDIPSVTIYNDYIESEG